MKERSLSPDETMKSGVSNLAESFVLPMEDGKHRYKSFIQGFVFPMVYIGLGWLFLGFLWQQFILSLLFVLDHGLDFALMLLVFFFFSALSYYWFQLTRSILSAARTVRKIVSVPDSVGDAKVAGVAVGTGNVNPPDSEDEKQDDTGEGRANEVVTRKEDGRWNGMFDDIEFRMNVVAPYDRKYEKPLGGWS